MTKPSHSAGTIATNIACVLLGCGGIAAAVMTIALMHQMSERLKWRPPAQVELLLELCGEKDAAEFANFLRMLSDNGRLGVLPEIAAAYEALRAEAEGRIEVEVRSAQPLGDATRAALQSALERRLSRAVTLANVIDPSLIGGAVIRAGDLVIDGSVHGRLQDLAAALKR